MTNLATIVVSAFLFFNIVDCRRFRNGDSSCQIGDVWVKEKIKFQCTDDGVKPTGCAPNNKLGEDELTPGQSWSSATFKFICQQKGPLEVAFDITACLLPNKTEFAIGASVVVPDRGIYSCLKGKDNKVTRKYHPGCYFQGKLYSLRETWVWENTTISCNMSNGLYEANATGCIMESGRVIPLGSYAFHHHEYFKCQSSSEAKWKGDLVKVSDPKDTKLMRLYDNWAKRIEMIDSISDHGNIAQTPVSRICDSDCLDSEYLAWVNGKIHDEEESADGISGTGYTHPPDPTTPSPPVVPSNVQQASAAQCCLRNLVPLYRLYSPSTKDYFYTTSPEEALKATNYRFVYETIVGLVSNTSNDCQCNSNAFSSVYRLFKAGCDADYIYTWNITEADNDLANLGYSKEGVAYYCPTSKGQCGATVSLNSERPKQGSGGDEKSDSILCYIWPVGWTENICNTDAQCPGQCQCLNGNVSANAQTSAALSSQLPLAHSDPDFIQLSVSGTDPSPIGPPQLAAPSSIPPQLPSAPVVPSFQPVASRGPVHFKWLDVPGTKSYIVGVKKKESQLWDKDESVQTTSWTTSIDEPGDYYFHVAATDQNGNPGLWTDLDFTVLGPFVPAPPVPFSSPVGPGPQDHASASVISPVPAPDSTSATASASAPVKQSQVPKTLRAPKKLRQRA